MKREKTHLTGELRGDCVMVGHEADVLQDISPLRIDGEGVMLSPAEAVYMAENGRLSVNAGKRKIGFSELYTHFQSEDAGFDAFYITYRDLRARGYRVETGSGVIRVFPRGGGAGKTPSRYWVRTTSERESLPLDDLLGWVATCARQHRDLLVSIVDGEGDITYYMIDEIEPEGASPPLPADFGGEAVLTGERVVLSNRLLTEELFGKWFIGKFMGEDRLVLSPHETCYLVSGHGMVVSNPGGNEISIQGLLEMFGNLDPRFTQKQEVYVEMRNHGLLPKTGYKFGCDFRVHAEHPEIKPHSPYLVHSLPQGYEFSPWSLASAVRLAHSVRKTMLYAHGKPLRFLRMRRQRL